MKLLGVLNQMILKRTIAVLYFGTVSTQSSDVSRD
jgi:hypothetical protein